MDAACKPVGRSSGTKQLSRSGSLLHGRAIVVVRLHLVAVTLFIVDVRNALIVNDPSGFEIVNNLVVPSAHHAGCQLEQDAVQLDRELDARTVAELELPRLADTQLVVLEARSIAR
jgi:hypothetical protein